MGCFAAGERRTEKYRSLFTVVRYVLVRVILVSNYWSVQLTLSSRSSPLTVDRSPFLR